MFRYLCVTLSRLRVLRVFPLVTTSPVQLFYLTFCVLFTPCGASWSAENLQHAGPNPRERGMQSFRSSVAALFNPSRAPRESEDGSSLLPAGTAESSPHEDGEDSDVVVNVAQAVDGPAVAGCCSSPTHKHGPTNPGHSGADGSPSEEDENQGQGISARTDSSVNCLICLEPIDMEGNDVVTLVRLLHSQLCLLCGND
jgi:hypothetical protein